MHIGRVPDGAAHRASAWTVLYDADCGLCNILLAILLRWDRARRLRPVALQRPEAADLLADLAPEERLASWHLIAPGGERRSGGSALAPLLRLLPAGRLPAACFERFPRLTDRGYRWVAEHRSRLSRLVPSAARGRATRRVQDQERTVRRHQLRRAAPPGRGEAP